MADTAAKPRPAAAPSRAEQRLAGRALAYWEELRGARRFPSRSDYDASEPPFDRANVFIVRMKGDEMSDEIAEAGEAVDLALGFASVGRKIVEVLPSATDLGLSFCRTAAQMRKPIADVGRFTNAHGRNVYYRSILLPLSDDQIQVNYVLGVFSFKFMD
jgi:hypothetical protein